MLLWTCGCVILGSLSGDGLVYKVTEDEIRIAACRYRYER
jgi:hypothetical protein